MFQHDLDFRDVVVYHNARLLMIYDLPNDIRKTRLCQVRF
jgi:hypothetical protein